MRIENEMLSRFNSSESLSQISYENSISEELGFFFDNVMETVVEYFSEKEIMKL
jgi:hypothetical protein